VTKYLSNGLAAPRGAGPGGRLKRAYQEAPNRVGGGTGPWSGRMTGGRTGWGYNGAPRHSSMHHLLHAQKGWRTAWQPLHRQDRVPNRLNQFVAKNGEWFLQRCPLRDRGFNLQYYIDLERLFVNFQLRDFFRLRSVCKDWNRVASNREFLERSLKDRSIPNPYFFLEFGSGLNLLSVSANHRRRIFVPANGCSAFLPLLAPAQSCIWWDLMSQSYIISWKKENLTTQYSRLD
jgi:hypothetical protein